MRIKGKTMCFVTSDPMRKKIEEIAAQTGGTMSTVINQLMADGLAAPKGKTEMREYVDRVTSGILSRLATLEAAHAKENLKWIERYQKAVASAQTLEAELEGKLDRPI